MIKKKERKNLKLEKNPYMYYITNWGFVENENTLVKTKN